MCEPWRVIITGKRELREEGKVESKEEFPYYTEKAHIYRSVNLPVETKPGHVKANLRNGML